MNKNFCRYFQNMIYCILCDLCGRSGKKVKGEKEDNNEC